jgi:hypothetical protein
MLKWRPKKIKKDPFLRLGGFFLESWRLLLEPSGGLVKHIKQYHY